MRGQNYEDLIDPVDWILSKYHERKSNNPQYSLRAFSRKIEFSSGALSQILHRKRPVTEKQIEKIADRLGIESVERKRVLEHFECKAFEKIESNTPLKPLSSSVFQKISSWAHLAILTLFETSDFESSPKWMAAKLGLDLGRVKEILVDLMQAGLIVDGKGGYQLQQFGTSAGDAMPDKFVREYHRGILERASTALDRIPLPLRDYSQITIAVDPLQIRMAKKLIKRFRRKLAQKIKGEHPTQIYSLSIQLYPLTK